MTDDALRERLQRTETVVRAAADLCYQNPNRAGLSFVSVHEKTYLTPLREALERLQQEGGTDA